MGSEGASARSAGLRGVSVVSAGWALEAEARSGLACHALSLYGVSLGASVLGCRSKALSVSEADSIWQAHSSSANESLSLTHQPASERARRSLTALKHRAEAESKGPH